MKLTTAQKRDICKLFYGGEKSKSEHGKEVDWEWKRCGKTSNAKAFRKGGIICQ